MPRFHHVAERGDQVLMVAVAERGTRLGEALVIVMRQMMKAVVAARALDFLFRQVDRPVEVAQVALLQERVVHHRKQGRRERHGHFERHAVAHEAFEHVDQRNVGLGDRLVEPVFF